MTVSCFFLLVVADVCELIDGIKVESVIVVQLFGSGIEGWKFFELSGDTAYDGVLKPTWSAVGIILALNHVGCVWLRKDMSYDAAMSSVLNCLWCQALILGRR